MNRRYVLMIITIYLLFFCFSGCAAIKKEKIDLVTSSDNIYVRRIENIPEDFIMAMDTSCVIALENSGVKYFDFQGNETDVYAILAQSGINYIRVRIWNNPYDEAGNGYGGGNCDIDNAIKIGKRANKYGMKLIVNFHYSDFWADPGKQQAPKAWENMNIEEKAQALYSYTKDCLIKLKQAGVDVGMVQLGNETNSAMAGETIWINIIYHLMSNGAKAVREVFPKALIAVHFTNPEIISNYQTYAKKLEYYNLDYDVFASSYYPFWHGSLDNLSLTLSEIATTYNKKVMVMETSYPYTIEDSDFSSNTISKASIVTKNYPYSIQGQTNAIIDLIDTIVNKTVNGIGICYWEGTWISVGRKSYQTNSELWEKYGSGWASSFASSYDPYDAGQYYGGCAVDNQAMFDAAGKPLESLKVFQLVKIGNEIEIIADNIEDIYLNFDLYSTVILPDKVLAIMNDNSKKEVDVLWQSEQLNLVDSSKPGKYTIEGIADGLKASCHVFIVKRNLLSNPSFEEDEHGTKIPDSWQLIHNNRIDELYVEDKVSDSSDGHKHFHFWSKTLDSVEFSLQQNISHLEKGFYDYSISIMGGDGGNTNIYAYVKINGEVKYSAPLNITVYNSWQEATIQNIEYDGVSTIEVGIYVKCFGANNGAWGKIDNARLTFSEQGEK
ncbi:MAG: glycosyl hydrolase 53 family protein [Bacillota bacterium]|jgi:arabinogalactan endo-1,4-beta-galactosidase|nr:glycosyl hydrolase 53 family protein [Bacillota bacterium]NLL27021.1 extra-cellular endo-beta-1,4-galactanase [Erysipelotrichia bacterium]